MFVEGRHPARFLAKSYTSWTDDLGPVKRDVGVAVLSRPHPSVVSCDELAVLAIAW